jgi:hypothetical protein
MMGSPALNCEAIKTHADSTPKTKAVLIQLLTSRDPASARDSVKKTDRSVCGLFPDPISGQPLPVARIRPDFDALFSSSQTR